MTTRRGLFGWLLAAAVAPKAWVKAPAPAAAPPVYAYGVDRALQLSDTAYVAGEDGTEFTQHIDAMMGAWDQFRLSPTTIWVNTGVYPDLVASMETKGWDPWGIRRRWRAAQIRREMAAEPELELEEDYGS